MLLGHRTYELSFEMELHCSLCPFYVTFQNVEDTSDSNGVEVEEIGVAFCKKLLGADTNWKQTSYNNQYLYQ